jgi:RNA polymerase sigma-70 factor (ECF subfamily)
MDAKAAPATPASGFDPARLIADHQVGIWRYLRALGCEPSLAEDLTQETFLAVFQRPFQELSPSATAAYLRTTARNLYVSHHRKHSRMSTADLTYMEDVSTQWSQWAGLDQGEMMLDALRGCLEELTERARLALEMRFGKQATRQEIAAAVNLTEDGAKNLMQRAKKQLKDCIGRNVKS